MKRLFFIGYALILLSVTIISWGFVDTNFPIKILPAWNAFIFSHRYISTAIYTVSDIALFACYGFFMWLVVKNQADLKFILTLIIITVALLFFSFPAFAYDIFNYVATAKVAFFYHENPYVVMPIEIPNEPMLAFMHAANKVALYGFVWILLTFVPWLAGLGNLILTVFAFKAYMLLFYGICLYFIWRISEKNLTALTFFALNPLVILETMISAHNDVAMMALALAAFYLLKKNKTVMSVIFLFLSVFIKFATLALIPVFIYVIYSRHKKRKIVWDKVWMWSAIAMYIPFFLSPLREEIYSWYLIWPLTFVSLVLEEKLLTWITVGFSFGLPFRFAPFLFTGDWGGFTPLIKKMVTFLPPAITASYYEIRKKI